MEGGPETEARSHPDHPANPDADKRRPEDVDSPVAYRGGIPSVALSCSDAESGIVQVLESWRVHLKPNQDPIPIILLILRILILTKKTEAHGPCVLWNAGMDRAVG